MLDIGVAEVTDQHQMFELRPVKRQLDPEEQALQKTSRQRWQSWRRLEIVKWVSGCCSLGRRGGTRPQPSGLRSRELGVGYHSVVVVDGGVNLLGFSRLEVERVNLRQLKVQQ